MFPEPVCVVRYDVMNNNRQAWRVTRNVHRGCMPQLAGTEQDICVTEGQIFNLFRLMV